MTIPGPELQQRIRRIEHGLSQVGTLLVPVEISDGVKKAITLANIDPDMALGRARKVLDFIISDLYRREFGRGPGTQPLENSVQQLAKAGKLPRTMVAYANSVRELGNVGIHGSGEAITEEDVVSSLENLMRLVAWYCEQVRPGGSEDKIEPEPPPIEDDKQAENDRVEKERAEKERLEKERIEKERADRERADRERLEKERSEKERADKEQADKERIEKERPPGNCWRSSAPTRNESRRNDSRKSVSKRNRSRSNALRRNGLRKNNSKSNAQRKNASRRSVSRRNALTGKRNATRRLRAPANRLCWSCWRPVFLVACCGGGSTTVRQRGAKQFLKHKYDGIALLQNGKYSDANLELLSAYSFDPNDDYVFFCLGEAESHLGHWKYAIDYYRRSLKIKPGASYAQVALANALLQSGDVDGAIAEYQIITSTKDTPPLDPATWIEIHNNYGQALLNKGDIQGSQRAVRICCHSEARIGGRSSATE